LCRVTPAPRCGPQCGLDEKPTKKSSNVIFLKRYSNNTYPYGVFLRASSCGCADVRIICDHLRGCAAPLSYLFVSHNPQPDVVPFDINAMRASLPMYDRPELAAAHDRLWQEIRERLDTGPEQLSHPSDLWGDWEAPDLMLSQTCGYPYRARLHGHVTLVATPDYRLPACPPGHYASVFVARADDPRDTPAAFAQSRFAYNERLSQSGWAAPATYAADLGFSFDDTFSTGSHAASAHAVAEGRADLCALDAQTWRLMQAHDPVAEKLRVIGRTTPTPALPYITASGTDPERLRSALAQAVDALSKEDRDTLGLYGIVILPPEAYLQVPTPPPPPA